MEAEYACADNRSHNINSAENSKLYHIYLQKMEKWQNIQKSGRLFSDSDAFLFGTLARASVNG